MTIEPWPLEWRTQKDLIDLIHHKNHKLERLCATTAYLLFHQASKDIGAAIGLWNRLTSSEHSGWFSHTFELFPRVYCKDGFNFSVQAYEGAYCAPRDTGDFNYWEVEVGYPSADETLFSQHERWQGDILPYCSTDIVNEVIEKHDGLWSGAGKSPTSNKTPNRA